jgi:hypothetical protein
VRVPDSKARQYCLARRYSGHDALPADCKVPWQLIVAVLRIRTSDPPPLAWHTPQSHSTAIRVVATRRKAKAAPASPKKKSSKAKKQSTTPKAKTASARKATKKSATKSQCEKPDEHRSHAGPPKSLDVNRASHGSGQALPALSRLIVYTTLELALVAFHKSVSD